MSYKPGDVLKDKYVIQEVLGQGSMGEVYRAEHLTIHRQFAIKLMHVHIAERAEALARFQREANAAALLDHPHICQVTDFDSTENGSFYIVMEYLKGETLRDRLNREGSIEIHSVFRIMYDLLCALECAHTSGIIHRDIKPENVSLIQRDERDDYVKLIDFGIAHAEKPNDDKGTLTQSGQMYGTPQYLSPEQVMGDPVDVRADLYSCGCMLFEMIEGKPPFNAENYVLLLNQHLVLDPPHLTKEIACAQELDDVIQKLLKKHPEERYNSALEVRAALADIANRFDPTLNLRMSQLGANSPVTSAGSTSAQTRETKPGLKSISNPYINPDEVQLLQNRSEKKPTDTLEVHEKHVSTKMGLLIAIAAGFFVCLVALVGIGVWMMQNHSDSEVISELDPEGYILSDEQIRAFAQTECHISEDDPLYQDEDIRTAVEQCAQGNFEEAYQTFEKSKNTYRENTRFFIMSLVCSYAVKRYRDAIRDALQLIIIAPDAVCTPAVREIIYSLYEDDNTYIRLRVGIMNLFDQRGASSALSWLLLMMPDSQHKKSFERLSDSIKVATTTFEDEYHETWLGQAVSLWDNRDNSDKRIKYQKTVDRIIFNELDKTCRDSNDENAKTDKCTMCYPLWQKRYAESNGAKK